MLKKAILGTFIVLSLFTYKYQGLVPLSLILVALSFYQVHKILLLNKEIMDKNTEDANRVITSLLNNQQTLQSDLKALKFIVDKHAKKINKIKEGRCG